MARQRAVSWAKPPTEQACPHPKAGRSRWSRWRRKPSSRLPEIRLLPESPCQGWGTPVSFLEERIRMETARTRNYSAEPEMPLLSQGVEVEKPPAWELVESGRYRPRRIRGSLLGRELG